MEDLYEIRFRALELALGMTYFDDQTADQRQIPPLQVIEMAGLVEHFVLWGRSNT